MPKYNWITYHFRSEQEIYDSFYSAPVYNNEEDEENVIVMVRKRRGTDQPTFQPGTRDDGTVLEPSVQWWGKSGSRADTGRDHERTGQEEEEEVEEGGRKGKAVPDTEPNPPPEPFRKRASAGA